MTIPGNNHGRDEATLELLVRGDAQGLRQLLEDHGGVVRGFLQRKFGRLLDHWQIDEAMSLAAIRIWQSAPRLESAEGKLRSWLAVIARNRALGLLAQRQGEPLVPIDGIDPLVLGVATSYSEAERLRMVADVHRCIDKLPPMQRAVLFADLNAGTTLAAHALAERLASTARSIWVARTRGRRELRRLLAQLGYDEELAKTVRKRNREQKSEESA